MELLRKALANAHRITKAVLASTFTAWFPSGSEEVAISCIGNENNLGDRSFKGLTTIETDQITIHVKLSDLPGGTAPAPESRFYAGPTAARSSASRYKVDSVRAINHLADHIEIKGSRN